MYAFSASYLLLNTIISCSLYLYIFPDILTLSEPSHVFKNCQRDW